MKYFSFVETHLSVYRRQDKLSLTILLFYHLHKTTEFYPPPLHHCCDAVWTQQTKPCCCKLSVKFTKPYRLLLKLVDCRII